jgi:hypothetical protein
MATAWSMAMDIGLKGMVMQANILPLQKSGQYVRKKKTTEDFFSCRLSICQ